MGPPNCDDEDMDRHSNAIWSERNKRHHPPSPSRRRQTTRRRQQTTSFLVRHLLLIVVSIFCDPALSREADQRTRLLYADDPDASIILEYQLHNAPSKDYTGDEQKMAARNQPGSEYDEERHIKPYFLLPENGPRVVQYYSPWCGHCQSFKAKYISLAKEMNLRLPEGQPEVHFHALSCSLYHWICMRHKIKAFPTIVALKADSADSIRLEEKTMTAENVAETLGIQLKPPVDMVHYAASETDGVDILGASLNSLTRTREAVYVDAALSFTHALKTGIFYKDAPLDTDERNVFADWIDLLYWALPPTWILHVLINDIRNNIDSVMFSEENLHFMVEKHVEVVHGGNMRWSEQCSKGDPTAGYSCGLWSLMHIVSVGVVERHRAVLGVQDLISTKYVAQTFRNYIEHFFDCDQCREYFVDMFDTCGFNHCRRFKQPKRLAPPQYWEEFPLWLWEVHNDVNVKLAEADWKRKGSDESFGLDRVVWPPVGACNACRDRSGKWDKTAIFDHLKKEYWPAGVQNFRFVVLKRKDNSKDEHTGILSGLSQYLLYLILLVAIVMWFAKEKYAKYVYYTGRHKKRDH